VGGRITGVESFLLLVDYKAGADDETIFMTGKRGETITLLLKPATSPATKRATSGITLSLTSPTLASIAEEVMPFRGPDWESEINTFSVLDDVTFTMKGEFTIPTPLPAVRQSAGGADPGGPGSYSRSLSGLVIIPVAEREASFITTELLLSYDVNLTLAPGRISDAPVWLFIQDWFGPSWRNLGIFAALGIILFWGG
jgi:hypothetical protein